MVVSPSQPVRAEASFDEDAIQRIHSFWFGPGNALHRWFGGDPDTDRVMADLFFPLTDQALKGAFSHWGASARGMLALLLTLDQFPRNLFRGQARAFEGASRAERLAQQAIAQGLDQQVAWQDRAFFYLPLEHAESLPLQEQSVRLFQSLRDSAPVGHTDMAERFVQAAIRHRDAISRFGRFPARNQALQRASTDEEQHFLRDHPAGF